MRRFGLAVAVVAAVSLLAGCGGGEDAGASEKGRASVTAVASGEGDAGGKAGAAGEDAAKGDVKIVSSGFQDHDVWGPNAYVVKYEITNSGEDPASYFAQLEFLDADKDVLGSTGITVDKLGSGKTNRGDTAPLESEITNGKMSDIVSVRVSEVERASTE